MPPYMLAFGSALTVVLVLTPLVRRLAMRTGALAQPVDRSMHSEPKPYLGGLAIYASFAAAVAVTGGLANRGIQGILIGGLLIVALGIVDDIYGLSAKWKLLGQIGIAAILVMSYGVRIEWVTNPWGGFFYLRSWSIPLTIFWIVAVVNVVNLIDGLDGLAAGISSIAALTLLLVALQVDQANTVLLTAALAGSALGFLRYNFNPAKIFMGDAGSMFLGYALAAVSVEGLVKTAATVSLAVPVVALGLPIFDTSFAILRRAMSGRPIHEADKDHLHHRLLRMGLSHREVVLVMYGISGWLGLSAIALVELSPLQGGLILGFVALSMLFGAKKVGVLDIKINRKH